MTTKLKSERLWRSIERYVELKAGRVGGQRQLLVVAGDNYKWPVVWG